METVSTIKRKKFKIEFYGVFRINWVIFKTYLHLYLYVFKSLHRR